MTMVIQDGGNKRKEILWLNQGYRRKMEVEEEGEQIEVEGDA